MRMNGRRGWTRRGMARAAEWDCRSGAGRRGFARGGRAASSPGITWATAPSAIRPAAPCAGAAAANGAFIYRRLVANDPPVDLPAGHVLGPRATLAGLRRSGDSVTWLGHASFLIRLGGLTLLTDPISASAPRRCRRSARALRRPRLPPSCRRSTSCCCRTITTTISTCRAADRGQRFKPAGGDGTRRLALFRHGLFSDVYELDWQQRLRSPGPPSSPCRRSISPSAASSIVTPRYGAASVSRPAVGFDPVRRRHHVRPGVRGAGPLGRADLALVPIGAYEPGC